MQARKRYTVSVEERSDSPCWQARMYLEGDHGKAKRWSTGVPIGKDRRVSKRLATQAAEIRADAIAREAFSEVTDAHYTVHHVGGRMLLAKKADGRRDGAVYMHALNLDNHVKPFFGPARDVRTITRLDLESFKAKLRGEGYAETTINGCLGAIRQTLKYACNVEEIIDSVPHVANVPVPKRSKRAKAVTTEQAQQYLACFQDDDVRDFNAFLLNTGLRRKETLSIRWDWIDWQNREINIPGEVRKGGREQRVPTALNDTALALLERRRANKRQPSKNRVFWQLKGGRSRKSGRDYDKARQAAATKAHIAGFRHHDARHTRATWMGASGASEIDLRDAMNWETFAMVSRYTHPNRKRVHELAATVELPVTGAVTGEGSTRGRAPETSVNQAKSPPSSKQNKNKVL